MYNFDLNLIKITPDLTMSEGVGESVSWNLHMSLMGRKLKDWRMGASGSESGKKGSTGFRDRESASEF